MLKLIDATFGSVRLGCVFYDPASGMKFQKIDDTDMDGSNVHDEKFNAVGNEMFKNFKSKDKVKTTKNSINSLYL